MTATTQTAPTEAQEEKKSPEKLFESYPHATLAFMAAGCGVIAVGTLLVEMFTAQVHASAIAFPTQFVSVPVGAATMILAGLVARANFRYALPALAFGISYWLIYLGWMIF